MNLVVTGVDRFKFISIFSPHFFHVLPKGINFLFYFLRSFFYHIINQFQSYLLYDTFDSRF